MKKKAVPFCLLTALAVALSACSSSSSGGDTKATEPAPAVKKTEQPVELSLYVDLPSEISDDEINQYLREPLKKKLPHITIKDVIRSGKGTERATLIAAGTFPDLMYSSNLYIPQLLDLKLIQDLVTLSKKNGFDFNKSFDSITMDGFNVLGGGTGKIYAMPFSNNYYGTFYNKDIFDKFGMPYPKDLMTYEDALDISKKITRVDAGVQYIGLDARTIPLAARGLSLPLVDPATQKSLIGTEPFRQVYQFFQDLYAIPGQITSDGKTEWGLDGFFKTRNVAMRVAPLFASMLAAPADMNWDITTVLNAKSAMDAAFQVAAMAASEEVQKLMARKGRIPAALQFSQFQNDLAADAPNLKNKNWAGVFKAKRRVGPPITPYQTTVSSVLATANKRLATEKIDINTLMRELQAAADAAIATEKAKGN
ncbi:MAG: family 1 extracellular solute-binding protein [Paenibacillus sp.]|nr:family 1 extracellular solute-binding protein [Paenibacillus sp.]